MRSYLLLLRFAVVNTVALAVLATLWRQGWVSQVFESDITHLTVVISAAFAVGLAIACPRCGAAATNWTRCAPTACVHGSTRASPCDPRHRQSSARLLVSGPETTRKNQV